MISQANWRKYISRLAAIDKKAADLMQKWIEQNGLEDGEALVQYAYALVTKYGETSATLASEMYDYMAELMDADIPPAVPAETATLKEVAKGVTWGKYHSPSQIPSVVSRQVRQAGADTMIRNAKRDHAQWAWVPQGDTCAFCITLASRGWQDASKTVLKGNHAEHIHQKCDCTFAIAFKPSDKKQYDAVYDPDKYLDMYMNASDGNPDDKIRAMRRQIYQKNKNEINAQRREAYQAKRLIELSQTEGEASIPANMVGNYEGFEPLELDSEDIESLIMLHKNSLRNQFEYGQILYDGGKTDILTDEMYGTVRLPVVQTQGANLRVYHSHTNETLPSSADFKPLTLEKVKSIGVISSNGDTWVIEIGNGYRPSTDELSDYIYNLEKELPFELMDYPEFYEWTPEERSYMLIREKCYRVCREFGWKLMGGSIDAL